MALNTNAIAEGGGRILVHPLAIRITHWINVFAMLIMIFSGWRIYNAATIFDFKIPADLTLGGWLGGALQWHYAAMWVLAVNGIAYLMYGILRGHFKASFLPLTSRAVIQEFKNAVRGKIAHHVGVYNAVQRAAYVGVIGVIVVLVLSGVVIWKPVQFQGLGAILGGFEGARIVHFAAMSLVVLFIVIHVTMVALVPRTFLPMLTGHARSDAHGSGG